MTGSVLILGRQGLRREAPTAPAAPQIYPPAPELSSFCPHPPPIPPVEHLSGCAVGCWGFTSLSLLAGLHLPQPFTAAALA